MYTDQLPLCQRLPVYHDNPSGVVIHPESVLIGSRNVGLIFYVEIRKLLSAHKSTSGRPAYSSALYQIQSAIAKLLVSFRCQVKIREGQAGETAWCYGCSR